MESALDFWRARQDEPWLRGWEPAALRAAIKARHADYSRRPAAAPLEITADDPMQFVAEFLAAITYWAPLSVFLGRAPAGSMGDSHAAETQVMIATGGTTGAPRYAVHTWSTLAAAARALQQSLGGGPINSVSFLPLSHVSGLMPVVRSLLSAGRLVLADWREIEAGRFPDTIPGAVTSVVPTQLARLFEVPGALTWLRSFRAVFVGGAPVWSELVERGRRVQLPLAPCYGMTETAAQVTMLPPEEFLAGREGVGRALPHARVEIVDEASENLVPVGEPGRIRVGASSLFRGYHLESDALSDSFLTPDRGVVSVEGSLVVLGRIDAIINTGGEKVDPAEVEAAIRATGFVRDAAVVGVPDAEWGEIVVALIVGAAPGTEPEIAARAGARLTPPQRPKRWVNVAALPRTEVGKIDRRRLRALAET